MARKKQQPLMQIITMDGKLEFAEAISVLSLASLTATAALPDALMKCNTQQQMQKVIEDRDTCVLAYTSCLKKSLHFTSPLFEKMASDLDKAAKNVKKEAQSLNNATDAVNLMTDLVRLSSSLALAFA